MAVELIRAVWCDAHMQTEEQVPGETITISIDGAKPQEVDLCSECDAEILGQLRELLAEDGRDAKASSRRLTVAASSKAPAASPSQFVKCPIKGCPDNYEGTRQNMRSHLENQHGTTLAKEETKLGRTLEGEKLNHFCPEKDCGLGFNRSQSLGVHMKRTHGIESSGRAAS